MTEEARISPKRKRVAQEELTKIIIARCKLYYDAIMADLHTSTSPDIFGVMKNVPDPYTSKNQNAIVRNDDLSFWDKCITELEGGITRRRMAVLGTAGIGKSTSVSLLTRLLLLKKKTVVYLLCSEQRVRQYIQFIPPNGNAAVEIEVFHESESPNTIAALQNEDTYFIVDPDETKRNCNPIAEVAARVIIVASSDDRHWGKSCSRRIPHKEMEGSFVIFLRGL
jgi:hypothetical protein